jgi:threonine dehydratase
VGQPVRLEKTASIADGLLTLQPGSLTFAHMQAFVDDVVTVEEQEIESAMRWLHDTASVVAEPSGAASVAGALKAPALRPGTVAVVSGGNISAADHARYMNR